MQTLINVKNLETKNNHITNNCFEKNLILCYNHLLTFHSPSLLYPLHTEASPNPPPWTALHLYWNHMFWAPTARLPLSTPQWAAWWQSLGSHWGEWDRLDPGWNAWEGFARDWHWWWGLLFLFSFCLECLCTHLAITTEPQCRKDLHMYIQWTLEWSHMHCMTVTHIGYISTEQHPGLFTQYVKVTSKRAIYFSLHLMLSFLHYKWRLVVLSNYQEAAFIMRLHIWVELVYHSLRPAKITKSGHNKEKYGLKSLRSIRQQPWLYKEHSMRRHRP